MTTAVKEFTRGPVEYIWAARLDTSGVPKGITGTISAGNYAQFRLVKGFVSLDGIIPSGTYTSRFGSNGVQATFYQRPQDPAQFTLGTVVLDQTFLAATDNRAIYTLGDYAISMTSVTCNVLKNIALIVCGRAQSNEAGSVGQDGWWTSFIWNVTMQRDNDSVSGVDASAGDVNYTAVAKSVDKTWWEETLSTNYITPKAICSDPFWSENPITAGTYVGNNGGSQTFTVDTNYLPVEASGDKFLLWEDGTKQTYTTDYTLVTTTGVVTWVNQPANNSDNFTFYEFTASC